MTDGRKTANAVRALIGALFLVSTSCSTPIAKTPSIDSGALEAEAQSQARLAFNSMRESAHRLGEINYRLRKAAVSLCGDDLALGGGFIDETLHSYPDSLHEAAREAGLGESPVIVAVYPGSPADKVGLRLGDVIMRIDGAPTPKSRFYKNRLDVDNRWKSAYADESAELEVLRDGASLTVTIVPEKVCLSKAYLNDDLSVNAYADGDDIYITRGMLKFTENDEELALIMAHELAHNFMGHRAAKIKNRLGGAVVDILVAVATQGAYGGTTFSDVAGDAFSQEFEAEADYVGLYIMANAGYGVEGAPDFWRRMAVEHPVSIEHSHASTHPSTSERYLALEKAIEEIRGKRERGEALAPNLDE